MKESFWYLKSSHLGFPFQQNLSDFPAVADTTNLVISRLLISLTGDINLTFNIQYFFSYFSGFFGAYVGSRLLRLVPIYAMCIGIIYTFLPFHYLHGASHLYLTSYWTIPLWLGVIVKELTTPGWVLSYQPGAETLFRRYVSGKTFLLLLLIIFSSSAGFYYSVFFILASGFFGLLILLRERKFKNLGLLLLSVTGAFLIALQTLPVLLFQRSAGSNTEPVQRGLYELRFYSLDMTKLFLPFRDHRLSLVREWAHSLDTSLWAGEYQEPLGFLLAFSFLSLLVIYVFQTKRINRYSLLAPLAQIELFFLGLAVVGGGGYFLGALGFTQIRVWSRISIALAFPALVFMFQLIDPVVKRLQNTKIQFLVVIGLAAFQILDTTPVSLAPNYENISEKWNQDERIANVIKDSLSPDAKIFQLPIVKFPESSPVYQLADYEHLRMYLHLPSAYFSYGGVKGRESQWQNRLSDDPETLFTQLALIGYEAVWIDRRGFEKNPSTFSLYAEKVIGKSIIQDESSTFELYDIREFSAGLKNSMSKQDQRKIKYQLLTPVSFSPGEGMSSLESNGATKWIWSSSTGKLDIQNFSRTNAHVVLTGTIEAVSNGNISIAGACKLKMVISPERKTFRCEFEVPKNGTQLTFTSDNLKIDDSDPRDLRFRLVDLQFTE
jgi:phosphoglycerol transferase